MEEVTKHVKRVRFHESCKKHDGISVESEWFEYLVAKGKFKKRHSVDELEIFGRMIRELQSRVRSTEYGRSVSILSKGGGRAYSISYCDMLYLIQVEKMINRAIRRRTKSSFSD